MPVIDGIYTKDFPDLGRAILSTDLIVVAIPGDNVTYKTTFEEVKGLLITGTFDGSGEYDASGDGIRQYPVVTVYDSTGMQQPVQYDNANQKLVGGSGTFTARFI